MITSPNTKNAKENTQSSTPRSVTAQISDPSVGVPLEQVKEAAEMQRRLDTTHADAVDKPW